MKNFVCCKKVRHLGKRKIRKRKEPSFLKFVDHLVMKDISWNVRGLKNMENRFWKMYVVSL